VLDQDREKKPSDPTIVVKFNPRCRGSR